MTFVSVSRYPRENVESRLTKSLGRYVRNVFIDEVVTTREGVRFASLCAIRPLFIFDDREGKGRLHWQVARKFDVVKLAEREGKIGFELDKLTKSDRKLPRVFLDDFLKTESAMLRSIEHLLVRIDLVQNAMSPITKLVSHVIEHGRVRPTDLHHKKGIIRATEYCDFLVSLGTLRKENGHYVEGGNFRKGEFREMTDSELFETVLAEIYKKGYNYMRTKLHLTGVVPYLNLSHAYYRPSSDYGEIVRVSDEQLWYWYVNFYGKRPPPATCSDRIRKLSSVGIWERQRDLIIGKEEIFDRFQETLGITNATTDGGRALA
jgi:hypothetical protein